MACPFWAAHVTGLALLEPISLEENITEKGEKVAKGEGKPHAASSSPISSQAPAPAQGTDSAQGIRGSIGLLQPLPVPTCRPSGLFSLPPQVCRRPDTVVATTTVWEGRYCWLLRAVPSTRLEKDGHLSLTLLWIRGCGLGCPVCPPQRVFSDGVFALCSYGHQILTELAQGEACPAHSYGYYAICNCYSGEPDAVPTSFLAGKYTETVRHPTFDRSNNVTLKRSTLECHYPG